MDPAILQRNINNTQNFSQTLQTPNQQLLSERFSLSPTPMITAQTISNGKQTNRTTEGFD